MIVVFTGDNTFEINRAVRVMINDFAGDAEIFDGESLDIRQLPDVLMGGTLFAAKRLVVIKNLSHNKALWADMATWFERVSDDVQLVLVEPSLDKRTKTAKLVQKLADVHEYKTWTDRDHRAAETWVVQEMAQLGGALDAKSAQLLVERIGVDQWALYAALQKLVVFDDVTPEVIMEVIEATPSENVFALFEAALSGNTTTVQRMIATLSPSEDPYRLFGLLSGQAFHLAALAVADVPLSQLASDVKAHPFALQKLTSHAKRFGVHGARHVVHAFSQADADMKRSAAEPWLLIERALLAVSLR